MLNGLLVLVWFICCVLNLFVGIEIGLVVCMVYCCCFMCCFMFIGSIMFLWLLCSVKFSVSGRVL